MNTSDRLEHQARRLGLRMVWHAGGQMLVRLGSDDPGVTLVTIEGPQANVSPQDWQRLQAAHPGSVVIGQQYVNPRQAERYRELGIPYLDTAGNAWLDLAGLKIWVEGKPRPVETTPRTPLPRAFTRTGTSTTIYGRPPWAELTKLGKLRPTRDDGNITLRERFWDEDLLQLGTSAPSLLDYAELVASGDPRQREVADELRDRVKNLP